MRPLHEFTVVSSLPPSLEPLVGLASNLHWAWDRQLIALFDRLDGTVGGPWRETDQHPVDLVRRTSPACWEAFTPRLALRLCELPLVTSRPPLACTFQSMGFSGGLPYSNFGVV
jgi:hypothetical protein